MQYSLAKMAKVSKIIPAPKRSQAYRNDFRKPSRFDIYENYSRDHVLQICAAEYITDCGGIFCAGIEYFGATYIFVFSSGSSLWVLTMGPYREILQTPGVPFEDDSRDILIGIQEPSKIVDSTAWRPKCLSC